MSDFHFTIDAQLFATLKSVIHEVAKILKYELAIELDFPQDDPELEELWKETLMDSLDSDCKNLLFLIGNESFARFTT